MMLLGVDLVVWSLLIGFIGGCYYGRATLRMKMIIAKKRRELKTELNKKMLPRPRATNRARSTKIDRASGHGIFNAWSESELPGVTMATTGCELTDAIFGAAHRADIVPQKFFEELERKGVIE